MHMIVVRQICVLLGSFIHGKANDTDHSMMGWREFSKYPQETKRLIYLRCLLDWVASVLAIFAVMLIPVSITVSMSRLSVFFTPLVAYLIDHEVVTKYEVCTIAGGFLGVVLIMNPTLFDSSEKDIKEIQIRQEKERKQYPYYYLGLVTTVLFALVAAVGVVYVRVLNKSTAKKVPANLQVYYYGLFTCLFVVITSIFMTPQIYAIWNLSSADYPISKDQMIWYLLIGLFCWLYTSLAPLALQYIKSSTFIPFTNLSIIMSFVFDISYFGRVMFWSDYVGAALIIFCTVVQSKMGKNTNTNDDDNYKSENS